MNAWAFNVDQLKEALAAWAESIAKDHPWIVEDLQRDTSFITMFLRSDQAKKLRIAQQGEHLSRTSLNPAAAWPFPTSAREKKSG